MTNRNSDALNEQILENLTEEQLQELKDLYVERLVDNMSTKDLVVYVTCLLYTSPSPRDP